LIWASTRAADLENLPSNLVGPPDFAREVQSWFKTTKNKNKHMRATLMGPKQLADEGMGLILGVGRGGEKPPCMLILEMFHRYPNGIKKKKGTKKRPLIALVGKGVTYDAGGMAIKPPDSMYGMHGDKTGASVAAAVLLALSEMDEAARPFDVVALLPAVENLVNEKAIRPGDIITACDGTKVEVVNPDAEGRLILADAMAYADKKYRPDFVIDFATLTSTASLIHPGISIAFHAEDDEVARIVEDAGFAAGECAWRLPPSRGAEYDFLVDSAVADIRNDGWDSNAAGAVAALFLRRFVKRPSRWLHLDIGVNTWNSGSAQLSSVPGEPMVGYGVVSGVDIVSKIATFLM
jgi:leucyl aminopeptidase